jgi:hypothetical protein
MENVDWEAVSRRLVPVVESLGAGGRATEWFTSTPG